MPIDPQQAGRFIRDPEFQAAGAQEQLALYRSFLSRNEPDYHDLGELGQVDLAKSIIDFHQPGFLSKLADVAEIVPVIGSGIHGARAFGRGEPLSPLAGLVTGGRQPESALEQAAIEAGIDVPLLAVGAGAGAGVARLARPAIQKLIGGTALTSAITSSLAGSGAQKGAGTAAKALLREKMAERVAFDFTFGEVFEVADAVERGIAGGEDKPLADFFVNPAAIATLGLGIMGLGGLARRIGAKRAEITARGVQEAGDPRYLQVEGEAGIVVEALRRASGKKLDRVAAADLAFDAATKPIGTAEAGQLAVIRRALQNEPRIMETELGQRLLRVQRDQLFMPEVRLRAAPGATATLDTTAGRTEVLEIRSAGDINRLRQRMASGEVVLSDITGNNATLQKLGLRPAGTERFVGPGGDVEIRPFGAQAPAGEAATTGQLPAVREFSGVFDPIELELQETVAAAVQENVAPVIGGTLLRKAAAGLGVKPTEQQAMREVIARTVADLGPKPTVRELDHALAEAIKPKAPRVRPLPGTDVPIRAQQLGGAFSDTALRGRTTERPDALHRVMMDLEGGRQLRAKITPEGQAVVSQEIAEIAVAPRTTVQKSVPIPPALETRIQAGQTLRKPGSKKETLIEERAGNSVVLRGSAGDRMTVTVDELTSLIRNGKIELGVGAGRLPGEALHRAVVKEGGLVADLPARQRTQAKVDADRRLLHERMTKDAEAGQVSSIPETVSPEAVNKGLRDRKGKHPVNRKCPPRGKK